MKIEFNKDGVPEITPQNSKEEKQLMDFYQTNKKKNVSSCILFKKHADYF